MSYHAISSNMRRYGGKQLAIFCSALAAAGIYIAVQRQYHHAKNQWDDKTHAENSEAILKQGGVFFAGNKFSQDYNSFVGVYDGTNKGWKLQDPEPETVIAFAEKAQEWAAEYKSAVEKFNA